MLLNVDAGELEGEPAELVALAHVVHVACGGHAGDTATMTRTLEHARAAGTAVGAHPSYPDREGFGRRSLAIGAEDLGRSIEAQCAALLDVARRTNVTLRSVKPHGALYHDGTKDPTLAALVLERVVGVLGAVTVVGPGHGGWAESAGRRGLRYLREGFADRGLRPDGSLVPRGEAGAMLESADAAVTQARRLARSGEIETLCVHGDGPHALVIARAVRAALDGTGE